MPEVQYITPDDKPPYAAVKNTGGLEPIQIVGVDGFSILATVHKRKGYEAIAAQFAASPELLEACKRLLDIAIWMSGSDDFSPSGKAGAGWARCRDDIDRAYAAVSKAEGK